MTLFYVGTIVQTAIIFDCEFLCIDGSQRRFWCGPDDPDPVIAQIGVAKLGLDGTFEILDTLNIYVQSKNRFGEAIKLSPFFSELTGITQMQIDREGVALKEALTQLDVFSQGAQFWSWGKDELNMLAISCYVEGIAPPIPATRFSNAVHLMLAADMPMQDIVRTPSNKLSTYFNVDHRPLNAHDALDDALSVAYTLQYLLREDRLSAADFKV